MMTHAFSRIYCEHTGEAMIGRFIEEGGSWNLAALHPVGNGSGTPRSEGQALRRRFGIAPGYEGCPRCGNRDYVRCNRCGELTCWAGRGDFLCRGCGQRAAVSGGISEISVEDYG